MLNSQSFPFLEVKGVYGDVDLVANLPLTLSYRQRSINIFSLLNTGASVNVLPYSVEHDLGIIWEEQKLSGKLAGNLGIIEAKGGLLSAQVGNFQPVNLVFA